MYKVDIRRNGKIQTVEFANEIDRQSYLAGETVYDISDYWVCLDGAELLNVYDEEDAIENSVIELNDIDIGSILFDEIMFFMLGESGAMGEPGAVVIITEEASGMKVYHGNFCYGGIDIKRIEKIFPPMETFNCGIFGQVSGVAEGWKHEYLGMGNHLFVREVIYDQFLGEIGDRSEAEVYGYFIEAARNILK